MELVSGVIGPLATNVHLVADSRSREAIAIDAAIPGLAWITGTLRERGWTLRLIVSTHGHWDHAGENAALQAWSVEQATHLGGRAGALIAAHRADWYRLLDPQPLYAPFPIPPCVPAVELAEGGTIRFGDVRLEVLHTPGHTEGSVCLLAVDGGAIFSGDTLFAGAWGRTDLPGGSDVAMVESLARLALLDDTLRVLPGHGPRTTIGRERAWLDLVARGRRLPL
jgi:glyoxylase-like metal-dependent hydrolase (beta-lactamase superfamily II)